MNYLRNTILRLIEQVLYLYSIPLNSSAYLARLCSIIILLLISEENSDILAGKKDLLVRQLLLLISILTITQAVFYNASVVQVFNNKRKQLSNSAI